MENGNESPSENKRNRLKTGGRKRGTPNKATAKVKEVFQNFGFCPLSLIIELSEGLSPSERISILMKILPYLYPKRTPQDGTKIAMSLFDD